MVYSGGLRVLATKQNKTKQNKSHPIPSFSRVFFLGPTHTTSQNKKENKTILFSPFISRNSSCRRTLRKMLCNQKQTALLDHKLNSGHPLPTTLLASPLINATNETLSFVGNWFCFVTLLLMVGQDPCLSQMFTLNTTTLLNIHFQIRHGFPSDFLLGCHK